MWRGRLRPVPVDGPNSCALVDEGSCDGPASRAGAEHDVGAGSHDATAWAGTNALTMVLCRKARVRHP
jgi:hypothetical protein